jgi:hypothetical protein
VAKWVRDPEFPGGRKGPWIHRLVKDYLLSRGRGHDGDADAGGKESIGKRMQRARAAKLEQEVRKLKIVNDKAEGRSIDKAEAVIEVAEIFGRQRDRFLLLAQSIADEVPSQFKGDVMRAVQRKVEELLGEMESWGDTVFGET